MTEHTFTVYPPDFSEEAGEPPKTFTATEENAFPLLRNAIGGWVEMGSVTIDGHAKTAWFDEEGRLKNLPPNARFPSLLGTVVIEEED